MPHAFQKCMKLKKHPNFRKTLRSLVWMRKWFIDIVKMSEPCAEDDHDDCIVLNLILSQGFIHPSIIWC